MRKASKLAMRRSYTVQDRLGVIVRRRWVILVPFAIGLALAGPIGSLVPPRYRSDAVLTASARGTDAVLPADRLVSMTQEVLSRPRLEAIVKEVRPYGAGADLDEAIARMREDISVTATNGGGGLRLGYVGSDPSVARTVTDRLIGLFVTSPASGAVASKDSPALDAEVADAKTRLDEQAKKLADFRRRQAGELRSQVQGSLQAMQKTQLQLQAVTESIVKSRERRAQLERQLSEAQSRPPAPPPIAAQPSGINVAEQLGMARAQLQLIKLRLPPDHPDVVSLERTIADIEAARVGQEAARAESRAAAQTPVRDVREIQDEIAGVDRQLAASRNEEARLKRALDQQANGDVVPAGDAELVELTRQYGDLQAAYSELLMKRDAAWRSPRAVPAGQPAQFSVLEPATLPRSAENGRSRLMIMGAAPLAGLLAGLMLLGVLERRDSSFKREAEVKQVLGLPVLALVPEMPSDIERQARRRRTLMTDLVGVVVLVVCVATLAFWRLVP